MANETIPNSMTKELSINPFQSSTHYSRLHAKHFLCTRSQAQILLVHSLPWNANSRLGCPWSCTLLATEALLQLFRVSQSQAAATNSHQVDEILSEYSLQRKLTAALLLSSCFEKERTTVTKSSNVL